MVVGLLSGPASWCAAVLVVSIGPTDLPHKDWIAVGAVAIVQLLSLAFCFWTAVRLHRSKLMFRGLWMAIVGFIASFLWAALIGLVILLVYTATW
jgi:hypothetical protein